ncbi:hydroxylase [Nocardioides nematodiphilus]|uniref:hydroxylase n=1 Tax=Nocardioides nematodiphilus TaxID=2849669 RepID=UPI001CD92AB7|nr:hydroxylase [Nocardioides nematodiphilus]MCA1983235.1 hydroxylase [Nocardioides nematodiphilus]
MSNDFSVLAKVEELADFFAAQAEEADALGRLPDATVATMKATGIAKILHPADLGGLEGSPVEFFQSLIAMGSQSTSAAWVAGVVGVHAFELAQADRRLQEEIWGASGEKADTWTASPYAPFGRAKTVEGGYIFSGRWPFSSGTDHCEWIILGGLITDADGAPIKGNPLRHFVLPRADYEIDQDSWNVAGLKGTGSKDIIINDAFIPEHRVINSADLGTFDLAKNAGRYDSPTYRMPFHQMFNGAIAGATLSAAVGALGAASAYMRSRVTVKGVSTSTDPRHLFVLAEAASDIDASVMQFLGGFEQMWDLALEGREIPLDLRARTRRDQVRAVHRSVGAVEELVKLAGGNALRGGSAINRFWRDVHMGAAHQANQEDSTYQTFGLSHMGLPLPPSARV